MNRILLVFLLITPSLLAAQAPTVQIKVADKSGFLGMGGPQFLEVRLSNKAMREPLTDLTVNSDSHYVFLCRPAGDWELDEDFVDEELSNLRLEQGEQVFPLLWKSEFAPEDTSLLIGFSLQVKLHEPIQVIFSKNGMADTARLAIPMDLWPGYSSFRQMETLVGQAISGGQHQEAIRLCEQILQSPMFRIFPASEGYRPRRTEIFRSYFSQHWDVVAKTPSDPKLDLKTKIARLDEEHPAFLYIQDSLMHAQLGIGSSDSGAATIFQENQKALSWMGIERDSLQKALEDQNVRWILEGSVAGRNGFLYQTILEVLAYAYSSLEFSDTAATSLQCTISEEMRGTLAKNNLTDSYDTFLLLTNERYRQGGGIFSPEFLENVRRDSASFRMPYFSMLKAVNDYYSRDFDGALNEIFRIFHVSFDSEISARYDGMRIMIQVRQGRFSPDAVRLLEEAEDLEATNPEAAGELFRRAGSMASNFAYASFALGKFYGRQGDAIRAQPFFVRAYESDSLYLSAYRESFNLYRRAGNYKPMIEVLTIAINKGNDYWETQSNLGLAYMGDGDPARAIQHYERALRINPQSYTTNIQLGLAYQTVKNYQKAREYFNNAINIDPLRQEAVEYLTRLNELQRSGK
ncbi:MAG: tetratricopeptide repeat protein [Bacteroidota bacterium]